MLWKWGFDLCGFRSFRMNKGEKFMTFPANVRLDEDVLKTS